VKVVLEITTVLQPRHRQKGEDIPFCSLSCVFSIEWLGISDSKQSFAEHSLRQGETVKKNMYTQNILESNFLTKQYTFLKNHIQVPW